MSSYFPIATTIREYKRDYVSGDVVAGIIVAIMLIPQGMAYALLAGLPPQAGLYASMLPLLLYGLLGTSCHLAVGPVAIVSLLTASSIGMIASEGSPEYWQLAITLALLVAIIQTVMGLFRMGFLVNFLSHPVLVGFSSAAAIVIGFSQMTNMLGFKVPRTEYLYEKAWYLFTHLAETNGVTLGLGIVGILILIFFKFKLAPLLIRFGVSPKLITPLSKIGPLLIVFLGTLLVQLFNLDELADVKIVGEVPIGLPPITLPNFDIYTWRILIPTALAISFVGYMESISVAKSLASKRRQKIGANQELIALGAANFGAAFTGGYPITGGFSRSLVNFAAGAQTTAASIITAALISLSVIFFTPVFYYIPNATLAAIILVAVSGLIDVKTFRQVWQYNKRDAAALIITFLAVLGVGIENGILVGASASLIMFIARTSNPHVAIVGRLGDSETYRNIKRHPVQTWPEVALLRVDSSLYFANTQMLEERVMHTIADQPKVKHFILIGTAINDIDYSALELLESLWRDLQDHDIELHLAAIKGPVLDRLRQSKLLDYIGEDHLHLTTHDAMNSLGYVKS